MRRRAAQPVTASPSFRLEAVAAARVAEMGGALDAMLAGELDAVIVREVFSATESEGLVAALRAQDSDLPVLNTGGTVIIGPPHPMGRFQPAEAAALFEAYLDAAGPWGPMLSALPHAPLARVVDTFRALAGGRDVDLAHTDGGRPFSPGTFRGLAESKQMQIHRGLYFLQLKTFETLARVVDCGNQLSAFMPIALPDDGGAIELFHASDYLSGAGTEQGEAGEISRELAETIVREHPGQALPVGRGDLLVFNGGRIYHRVSAVVGPRWRWTFGMFLNRSRDLQRWLYWA